VIWYFIKEGFVLEKMRTFGFPTCNVLFSQNFKLNEGATWEQKK
jgi:hypothetical protein